MNDKLKIGLVMQGIQLVFLVICGAGYFLSGIDWTTNLVITICVVGFIAIFNLLSLLLIATGMFTKGRKTDPKFDY